MPTNDSAIIPAIDQQPTLLTRYRGHRTRTWGDAEAMQALDAVRQGAPKSRALREAGIPEDAAYYHPEMAAAISELYTHEGADALEERLEQVEDGNRDHRAVPAIVARLKLRGKLQPQSPQVAVQVNVMQGGGYVGWLQGGSEPGEQRSR